MALLILILWAHPGQGEPWVVKASVEGVAVQVRGPSDPVPLDADFAVTVTVTREPDVSLEPPTFVTEVEDAIVSDVQAFGPDPTGEFVSQSWRMTLEPIRAGALKLPPMRIGIRKADGSFREEVLTLPPVTIAEGEGSTSIETLRPIPPLSPPRKRTDWRTILIVAGSATALLTLLAVLWPRRRAAPSHLRERAMNDLTRIEFNASGSSPRAKAALAGDVVRNYLEDRYHMPASRQTTWEFLRDARNSPNLAEASQDMLSRAFPLLDEEKFGPEGPSSEDVRQLIALFREFLANEPDP